MPIYEFNCRACGNNFEEFFHSAGKTTPPPCPACSSRRTQKKLSVFSMGGAARTGGSNCNSCSRSSCAGCR